jgi:hypothetical protein
MLSLNATLWCFFSDFNASGHVVEFDGDVADAHEADRDGNEPTAGNRKRYDGKFTCFSIYTLFTQL